MLFLCENISRRFSQMKNTQIIADRICGDLPGSAALNLRKSAGTLYKKVFIFKLKIPADT